MNKQDTVILTCSSLVLHVNAAQKKMGTDFKIIPMDKRLHADPQKMRETIIEKMESLPDNITTVLVSMGFCGGSWRNVPLKHRVVIPRVDDCMTLLLHKDNKQHSNLKEPGHLYFRDGYDNKRYDFVAIKESLCKEHGSAEGIKIFQGWFKNYTDLNVVDTGVYDCHCDAFKNAAERNAVAIGCKLSYVQGSNIILEKLVSGNWDEQFYVGEPGTCTEGLDYLDSFNNAHSSSK